MKSIIIILSFSLLSSVTFSQHAMGGWGGKITHNGVNVHGDTIHVNYGEVVEIGVQTYNMGGSPPPASFFNWYLDDVLVPLETFIGRRFELNQPGKWVHKVMFGSWNKWVVVVWDNEYVPEAFDSGDSLNSKFEKEVPRESALTPNTVDLVPNPTRGMLKLVSAYKVTQLNILNQAGVIVYSSSPGTNEAVVHLNHLARGLYFAEVISEHGDRTIKRVLVVD